MQKISLHHQKIHENALKTAQNFIKSESDLIAVLREVDQNKTYLVYGEESLFSYATRKLLLSSSVAGNLISIARKSAQVPELKLALEKNEIHVTHALRIAPILTQANQTEWVEKAKALSSRELEKQIASAFPEKPKRTWIQPQSARHVRLELDLEYETLELLKKFQDLVSRSKQRNATEAETLHEALLIALEKLDPVRKAERARERQEKQERREDREKKIQGDCQTGQSSSRSFVPKKHDRVQKTQIAYGAIHADQAATLGHSTLPQTQKPQAAFVARHADQAASQSHSTLPQIQKIQKKQVARVALHADKAALLNQTTQKPRAPFTALQTRPRLPASVIHAVELRDQSRCTHVDPSGKRCTQTRFLHFHHVKPVSEGGLDTAQNLTLLCSSHHRLLHFQDGQFERRSWVFSPEKPESSDQTPSISRA